MKASYPDGTCEMTVYQNDTGLVAAHRDRNGRWLLNRYDGYLLDQVERGQTPSRDDCASQTLPAPPDAAAGSSVISTTS